MRHLRVSILLSVCLVAVAGLQAQGLAPYRMDPAHSSVGFMARHFTVSKVRGTFDKFTGNFLVDEKDFARSHFDVTLEAASVNTRVENRDNHLRSADFLDAATHPQIAFKSKRIEKTAEGYVAVGNLTIRGATREVPLRFTLVGPIKDPRGSHRLGVEASATINRQEFGVSWNRLMEGGGLVVSDTIEIEISAELVKANPEPSPPPPPK